MSGINTNRTSITLPSKVSSQIIQTTQENSAIMQLANKIDLPGAGLTIPMITGDPEAAWVGETDEKPVSNPTFNTKLMTGYTLAVIVPFSNQFKRDMASLYNACVERLPKALALKFDATVFGNVTAPGSNFDQLTSITAQTLNYAGLVAADTDIANHNGITNGFVISPKAKGALLATVDSDGRPLFINSVAEGAIPMILGSPTYQSKGAFVEGDSNTPDIVGFAGDWTQASYGIVKDVSISISDQATLTSGGNTINLWQRNMFAVRAEIEIGFRADKTCFNALTLTHA